MSSRNGASSAPPGPSPPRPSSPTSLPPTRGEEGDYFRLFFKAPPLPAAGCAVGEEGFGEVRGPCVADEARSIDDFGIGKAADQSVPAGEGHSMRTQWLQSSSKRRGSWVERASWLKRSISARDVPAWRRLYRMALTRAKRIRLRRAT